MPVLQATTGTGTVRRCNRVCWRANGERCECICGGAHHGFKREPTVEEVERLMREVPLDQFEHIQLVLCP